MSGQQGFGTAEFGWGGLAVDDVLFVDQGTFTVLNDLVAYGDKQQRAGAAVLFLDVEQGGNPLHLGIDLQRAVKRQTATRPHTVAVVGRWQEAATCRVAVGA
ncbi:hypothetical protein D3C85_1694380 [compost metagenome]